MSDQCLINELVLKKAKISRKVASSHNFCIFPPKTFFLTFDTAKKSQIQIISPKPKIHKCELCQESFVSERQLANHYDQFHEGHKMKYYCNLCEKSFSDKSTLNNHIKVHLEETPYQLELSTQARDNQISCIIKSET